MVDRRTRRPARRTSWSTCCCPSSRRSFTDSFFRTADGQPGEPITSSPYLIADGVTIALNPPGPDVLRDVRALWAEVRKSARVLVLMDVSGSMASDSGSGGKSKLDLAKSAATTALDQLVDTDQVGFWVFTTDLPTPDTITADLVDVGPLSQTRQPITDAIAAAHPAERDPAVRGDPGWPPTTMNASQGSRRRSTPSWCSPTAATSTPTTTWTACSGDLEASAQENGVRVFTIAYGPDADLDDAAADLGGIPGGRLRCP